VSPKALGHAGRRGRPSAQKGSRNGRGRSRRSRGAA
jgi:hypothetical protein